MFWFVQLRGSCSFQKKWVGDCQPESVGALVSNDVYLVGYALIESPWVFGYQWAPPNWNNFVFWAGNWWTTDIIKVWRAPGYPFSRRLETMVRYWDLKVFNWEGWFQNEFAISATMLPGNRGPIPAPDVSCVCVVGWHLDVVDTEQHHEYLNRVNFPTPFAWKNTHTPFAVWLPDKPIMFCVQFLGHWFVFWWSVVLHFPGAERRLFTSLYFAHMYQWIIIFWQKLGNTRQMWTSWWVVGSSREMWIW